MYNVRHRLHLITTRICVIPPARALHHLLERKYHDVTWPSVTASIDQLIARIVKRINEASGIYQMFGVLGDVIVIDEYVVGLCLMMLV